MKSDEHFQLSSSLPRCTGWQRKEELVDQPAVCPAGLQPPCTLCRRGLDSSQSAMEEFKECMDVIEEQLRESNGMSFPHLPCESEMPRRGAIRQQIQVFMDRASCVFSIGLSRGAAAHAKRKREPPPDLAQRLDSEAAWLACVVVLHYLAVFSLHVMRQDVQKNSSSAL